MLLCFRIFLVRETFGINGGGGGRRSITIFRRIFFRLNVPKKTRRKIFGVSENFGYQKVLCIIGRAGGWGILQFSVGNLLSHGTKKLLKENLLCLIKLPVSKTFGIRGEGEGVSGFSVEIFLSDSTTIFVSGVKITSLFLRFVDSQYQNYS